MSLADAACALEQLAIGVVPDSKRLARGVKALAALQAVVKGPDGERLQ